MLENDILLNRYLDRTGPGIAERDVAALDRLLDMGDNELWELLSGKTEPGDAQLQDLVKEVRRP